MNNTWQSQDLNLKFIINQLIHCTWQDIKYNENKEKYKEENKYQP